MDNKTRAVIQQALEHKRSCAYKRIDQNPSECTCGVTEALTALREALEHSCEVRKRVLTGFKITNVDDKLEFEPVYSEPVKRPQNCGTGYCSCIECPYEAEQAEQEPVGMVIGGVFEPWNDDILSGAHELYAAPVRTKDLTDDEISKIWDDSSYGDSGIDFARAVIAADREKNK